MSDRQAGRLRAYKLMLSHVCKECHSLLTSVWDSSKACRLRVVCSKDHTHEGFTSKATVERQEQRARVEGQELHKIFPELSGYTEPTQAEIDKDMTDLFG